MRRHVSHALPFLLVLALAGCTKMINMDAAKTAVSAGLTEKLGMAITAVTCPDSRAMKAGDVFNCTAAVQTGGQLVIRVTQKDDAGNIAWELVNGDTLIDLALLESSIKGSLKDQKGIDATIACGGKYRVAEPGKTFQCAASDNSGNKATVTITMKDDKGHIDWVMGTPTT
jgi:hypothetical protein